jgi:polyhydroxybutyrate depolymerase
MCEISQRYRKQRCVPTMLLALVALGCADESAKNKQRCAEDTDDDGCVDLAPGEGERTPAGEVDAGRTTLVPASPRDAGHQRAPLDAGSLDARSPEPADARASSGVDAAVATSCSGMRTPKPGKSVNKLMAGGLQRSFIMHVPKSLAADQPVPLLIVPHGYTQNGDAMYRYTGYPELAEREGFVALFPDGQTESSGPWNVGAGTCTSVFGFNPVGSGDDQAFLDAMVEFANDAQCIDREHIFVTGWSMGGFLANETGCLREQVRAIGPHSAGSHDLAKCPVAHKPVILFHGTGDRLIPFECGVQARERWVEHNGCSKEVEVTQVRNGRCEYHKGCPADGQVAFCQFTDMNHGWAGGPDQQVSLYPSAYSSYESASALGWAFFKKYAW